MRAKTVRRVSNKILNATLLIAITAIVLGAACRLVSVANTISRIDNFGIVSCCILIAMQVIAFAVGVESERREDCQ